MQVHIDRGGERYGPHTLEEVNAGLTNGTLLSTDLAWQDGMANWVPIEQLQGVVIPGGLVSAPSPSPALTTVETCPQCNAPVEVNQLICIGCGYRLKLEDPRTAIPSFQSQDLCEDSPDVVDTDKKKDMVSFWASALGVVILMGVGVFLMAKSSDITKPTPREQFGWVLLIFSGPNSIILALSLWIYFRVEVGPFKHGFMQGITKCAAFNLLVSVGGYVFVYLVPEILNNNYGTYVKWDGYGMVLDIIVYCIGMKWFFDCEIWDIIGLFLVQAGVVYGMAVVIF